MGSGAFAVPVLRSIVEDERFELTAIVTQPDKVAGRKKKLTPTPVGAWADARGLFCERAPNVNDQTFLDWQESCRPDVIVVVSFGQLLKQPLLELPLHGCLNVHASLLPKYRGASPISTAILNGDEETGVTFMQMARELDAGPMFAMARMPIEQGMTTEILENLLAERAAECIGEVIECVVYGQPAVSQPDKGVSLANKVRKSDGSVDWSEDASVIERKVRAYAKWPSMRFCCVPPGKDSPIQIKITSAKSTAWTALTGQPGRILAIPENRQIMVQCGQGALLIERVLPEGKKEMAVSDFLNGVRLAVGDVLLNGPDKIQNNDPPAVN